MGQYEIGQLLPSVSGVLYPSCDSESFPEICITHSHLDAFSYNLATGAFDAHGANEGYPDRSLIDTGVRVGFFGPPGTSDTVLAWTPQTYITVRPVPEPQTSALAAAGLLALGAAGRRRRRAG